MIESDWVHLYKNTELISTGMYTKFVLLLTNYIVRFDYFQGLEPIQLLLICKKTFLDFKSIHMTKCLQNFKQ